MIEWAVLNRQLPSWKSTGALLSILVAATGYVLADSQMKLVGLQVSRSWKDFCFLFRKKNVKTGLSFLQRNECHACWGQKSIDTWKQFPSVYADLSILL